MYYPWQKNVWDTLSGLEGRMPHALLLHGRPGTGKLDFALALSKALLCEHRAPSGPACASCDACRWFEAGNHPDFRLLQPEILSNAGEEAESADVAEEGKKKSSKQVKIEQIRELSDFLNVSSHRKGHRVVLVHPAEAMNAAAANALLKALEEPSPGVVFLLVSNQPNRLLPTVRSRCQAHALPTPDRDMALKWLKKNCPQASADALAFTGNAPLAAASHAESEGETCANLYRLLSSKDASISALADACAQTGAPKVTDWMQKWVYDLSCVASGLVPRYAPGYAEAMAKLAPELQPSRLQAYFRELSALRAIAEHPLNPRLFLEDLFIAYKEITR